MQIAGELQREGQGTGLGLTLTRKLVGLLGGELDVAERARAGTTFTVWLPIKARARRRGSSELSGAVLVVDDDETVALRRRGPPARHGVADRDRGRRLGGAGGLEREPPGGDHPRLRDARPRRPRSAAARARQRADRGLPVIIHTSRLLEPDELEQPRGTVRACSTSPRRRACELLEALAGGDPGAA